MPIKAEQLVTEYGRRVLTDDGQQGMDGKPEVGSTTEKQQGHVAAAIFANCSQLDKGLCRDKGNLGHSSCKCL